MQLTHVHHKGLCRGAVLACPQPLEFRPPARSAGDNSSHRGLLAALAGAPGTATLPSRCNLAIWRRPRIAAHRNRHTGPATRSPGNQWRGRCWGGYPAARAGPTVRGRQQPPQQAVMQLRRAGSTLDGRTHWGGDSWVMRLSVRCIQTLLMQCKYSWRDDSDERNHRAPGSIAGLCPKIAPSATSSFFLHSCFFTVGRRTANAFRLCALHTVISGSGDFWTCPAPPCATRLP